MSAKFKYILMQSLPWIFIVVGAVAVTIGYKSSDSVQNDHWLIEATKAMGTTILGAGIFAAVLKSFQFTGVFQRAIIEVIYGHDYLKEQERGFVEEKWKTTTKALFTGRIPKHADAIEKAMLSAYFPKDCAYYYDDMHVSYNKLGVVTKGDKAYITFEQVVKARLIPIESKGTFTWSTSYEGTSEEREIKIVHLYKDDEKQENLKTEVEQFAKVTGKPRFEKSFSCACRSHYNFEQVENRLLDVADPDNHLIEVVLNTPTIGLTVSIPELDTTKFNIKLINRTLEPFLPLPNQVPGNLSRKHFGVVLPSHGFCIVLGKI